MNDTRAKELGDYIRQARENAAVSIRGLAARVDINQAQIIRLEQGKVSSPKADLLGRIADELGVPVSDLLTMAGYPTSRELPALRPYMRSQYRELPPEAVDEVEALISSLTHKYGGSGPAPGEDEL